MTADDRIETFHQLGQIIGRYIELSSGCDKSGRERYHSVITDQAGSDTENLEKAVKQAGILNPWFTQRNVITALKAISRTLNRSNLSTWLSRWDTDLLSPKNPSSIGVIMAGNIPLAGFHDFLSVLITGHKFIGKLSSRDDQLLPSIAKLITVINKELGRNCIFTDDKLSGIDAIIATGSNNTFRYFNYYFGKYPHLFRKNRNGTSILQGNETPGQLAALGEDIFTYFGLGCRNVSKIFVPSGYKLNIFFDVMEKFSYVTGHNKYMNNYQYYRSVYLLNKIPHSDNGFLLLKQDATYKSPVGVLYYEYYSSPDNLIQKLNREKDQLQCIVSDEINSLSAVPFGKTQFPELWDYADNINTIDFLINLVKK